MRILLVDDEIEFIETLAERLVFRNIEAEWTADVDQAIEMARQKKYDIAVLDVKMPKMNGIELKKKLQEIQPEMKFLFITGHGSDEDYLYGSSEAGHDNYLAKPLDIDVLIKIMQKIMANS